MGGHGDKGGGEKGGPNRILRLENRSEGCPKIIWEIWAKTPEREIIWILKYTVNCGDSAWNRFPKVPDNETQAREHYAGLDNIRPDHGLDAAHGRVDGSQRHQHK